MTSNRIRFAAKIVVPIIVLGGGISMSYYFWRHFVKKETLLHSTSLTNLDDEGGIYDSDLQKRALAYKELGNKNFRAGRYPRSIECYSQAISLIDQDNVEELCVYFQNRATAYGKLNNLDQSLADVNEALDLKPRYLKALNRRSRVFEDMHRYLESLQDVTALCLMENFSVDDNTMRAENLMRLIAKEMAEEELKTRLHHELQSNTTIKSFFMSFENNPIFMVIRKTYPSEAPTSNGELDSDYLTMSNLNKYEIAMTDEFENVLSLLKSHKYGESFDILLKHLNSLQKEPASYTECHVLALLLSGTFNYLSGKHEISMQQLNEVQEICISNTSSKNSIANGDNTETNKNEIRNQFYQYCHVHSLIVLAMISFNIFQSDSDCEKYFSEAGKVMPSNCDIYYNRGYLRILSQDADVICQSEDDFKKAVVLSPNNAVACAYQIYARFIKAVREQRELAVRKSFEAFKSITKKFPDSFFVHFLYGQLLTEDMQIPEALEEFERAMKIDPSSPLPYIHISLAKMRSMTDIKQMKAELLPCLKTALNLDDKCELGHQLIANVYTQICDLDKSIEHYRIACNLSQNRTDLEQTISLREAAICQKRACEKYNIGADEMQKIRVSVAQRLQEMTF